VSSETTDMLDVSDLKMHSKTQLRVSPLSTVRSYCSPVRGLATCVAEDIQNPYADK
jgi:hypothetical protein